MRPDGHDDCKTGEAACQQQPQDGQQLQQAQNTPLQKAKVALDWFNGNLGLDKSNCAGGGDCLNALGMAGTAILTAGVSDGASEEGFVEKLIATASTKIENIETKVFTSETLQAAANGKSKGE